MGEISKAAPNRREKVDRGIAAGGLGAVGVGYGGLLRHAKTGGTASKAVAVGGTAAALGAAGALKIREKRAKKAAIQKSAFGPQL